MLKLTVRYEFTNKTGGTTTVISNRTAKLVWPIVGGPFVVTEFIPKAASIRSAKLTDKDTGKITRLQEEVA